MNKPIIIVGAGLSGLHAASMLVSQGIDCKVLEARGRIGGRILSKTAVDKPDAGMFDLGPTWFWPQHEPIIASLVKELGLEMFEQHIDGAILLEQSQQAPIQRHMVPEGAVEKSARLIGGVGSLVEALASTLHQHTVELNTSVTAIRMNENEQITIEAELADGKRKSIRAGAVILALPPRIVAERIAFSPALPNKLKENLTEMPTWMAGQAKTVAVYNHPFWREDGLSGQAMSWAGPLQEIHDASSPNTGYGALFGFFGIPVTMRQELGRERILELVVEQLSRLFGPSAEKPISLLYKDWSCDLETAVEDDSKPLTTFPNYGRPTSANVWEKKVAFAGTETSPKFGGHLEGALQSAESAVSELLN